MQAPPPPELLTLASKLDGLIASGTLTQTQIAQEIGVDQAFVSNAQRGKLRRVTPRVRRLIAYVDIRVKTFTVPQPILEAAKAYMAGGGNPDLLAESIRLLAAVRSA